MAHISAMRSRGGAGVSRFATAARFAGFRVLVFLSFTMVLLDG